MPPGYDVTIPELELPSGWSWREDPHALYLCEGGEVVAVYPQSVDRGSLFSSVAVEVARRRGLVVVEVPVSLN